MLNLVNVHRSLLDDTQLPVFDNPYIAFAPNGDLVLASQADDQIYMATRTSTGWVDLPTFSGKDVVALLGDETNIILLKDGQFIEVNSSDAVLVGSLDTEIAAAEWSPDQEVLCLSTADKVVFMSRSLDLLAEHVLGPEDLNLSKHVSIGWGKKETQFEGRGAHALRDPTMPSKVDSGVLDESDDGRVSISWRGDGDYVSVSSIQSERRVIRVFSRSGELSNVSEPTDLLTGINSWKPSGAVIASVQTAPHQVVFFERNGLRRYEFALSQSDQVFCLSWSPDSSILAVQFKDYIELWTTKNYHWYRKQVVRTHTGQSGQIKRIEWHPQREATLLVSYGSAIETFSFLSAVTRGLTTPGQDNGTVAVIDTEAVGVTPLGRVNIPPPLSLFKLTTQNVISTAVNSDNSLIAAATLDRVDIYKMQNREAELFDSLDTDGLAMQVSFTSNDELVVLRNEGGSSTLYNTATSEVIRAEPNVYLLKDVYVEHVDGSISLINGSKLEVMGSLGRPCIDFAIHNDTIFGLTSTGELIVSNPAPRILASGITSMLKTDQHLLLTTLTQLKVVHLDLLEYPEDGTADKDNEQTREIERGSILITAIPSKMAVVLQAPRGNLETIYPRILVLGEVRKSIRELDYGRAFVNSRVHRIDLNLLYDYLPTQFDQNAAVFIEQIKEPEHIDLFLSSLRNENVAKTKYVETSLVDKFSATNLDDGIYQTKVNHICELLLPLLPSRRNVISALAYKLPPDLVGALKAAKDDTDVEHLVFLTDADLLYQTTLGMYDLKRSLVVAQFAQKDPKEFLPFLRAREQESALRRQYMIDTFLHRYPLALESLAGDPDTTDEELLEFVERHRLYEEALALIGDNELRRSAILRLQADAQLEAGEYSAAGLRFEVLGILPEAIRAYSMAGDWRRVLSLDNTRATELAEICVEQKKYGDAAQIYDYYLNETVPALEFYCKAGKFDDAILKASRDLDDENRASVLDSILRQSFGVIQELLSDFEKQINSQLERLREVREKTEKDALGFENAGVDITDDVSIAGTETTGASFVTRYTDKTGGTAQTGASRKTMKNRRREERKRARGKKGTIYEEEYLLGSTGRLIERLTQTKAEAQGLADALWRRKLDLYALNIKSSYKTVVDLLRLHIEEIFTVSDQYLVRYENDGTIIHLDRPTKPIIPEPLI